MELDGIPLEGEELEMHVACRNTPDPLLRETLVKMARLMTRQHRTVMNYAQVRRVEPVTRTLDAVREAGVAINRP